MKNKKAVSLSLNMIAIGIIIIITLIIIIASFSNLWGRGIDDLKEQQNLDSDPDGDNIASFFDSCPCERGDARYNGCPTREIPENPSRSCLE